MEEPKDDLEQFIQNNQDSFDKHEPSNELWNKINQQVGAKEEKREPKMIKLSTVYRIAAVFVIAVGIGLAWIYLDQNSAEEQTTVTAEVNIDTEEEKGAALKDLSPELAEVETYYATQINYKMDEVKSLQVNEELLEDINYLKEEYEVLKKEVGANIDNEKVIEAMVQNYRLRLEILEHILQELQEDNGATNENDTKDVSI